MAYKSKYKVKNRKKYIGDPDKVVCRSLWERQVCKYFDSNRNIIRWGSEEVTIKYYSPIDKKMHRYYPDFIVEKINKDKEIETLLIEVKPYKQTLKPERKKKSKRTYLSECKTFEINSAKWKAAEEVAKRNDWKFLILTEKEIFPHK